MTHTAIVDRAEEHALRVVIEEELRQRLVNRRWYRSIGRRMFDHAPEWQEMERENALQLRQCLRFLRTARRLSA